METMKMVWWPLVMVMVTMIPLHHVHSSDDDGGRSQVELDHFAQQFVRQTHSFSFLWDSGVSTSVPLSDIFYVLYFTVRQYRQHSRAYKAQLSTLRFLMFYNLDNTSEGFKILINMYFPI